MGGKEEVDSIKRSKGEEGMERPRLFGGMYLTGVYRTEHVFKE